MTVKSGQAWYGLFVCKDATGALSTPSVGPAGALYVDGTVNAASVTISGSNPYKFAVTLPALTAGQCVSMYITATIATIATASVVAENVADTVRLSDVPAVNVTMQAGVAVAAADANGNIPVDVRAWRGEDVQPTAVSGVPDINLAYIDTVAGGMQGIRDANKLAPTAGAPAAGSVDAKLDDILTTIGSEIVEGTYTRDDILRIIAAALAGETSGSGTPTVTITGLDGATTRITATVDGNGNRTGMTLDGAA